MLLDTVLITLLILLNAFFVASEFAIVKVRTTQLAPLKLKGIKRAQIGDHIIHHLNEYLSACQLGITLTSLGLGWIAEPIFENLFSPVFIAVGLTSTITIKSMSAGFGFALITFLHITIGEIAPKTLAIQYPKGMTLFIAIPLKIFNTIFRPVIVVINGFSILILKMIGVETVSKPDAHHSEEELRLLLQEGEKTGVIDDTEHELIENIFDFAVKSVGEILIPRTLMFTLQADIPMMDAITSVVREGYSRIPVYGEDQDDIVGILFSKDLLKGFGEAGGKNIRDLMRPPFVLVKTKPLSAALRDMQLKHVGLAIVVNEYGGLEGMITTEDILEEIVGEIQDEHDTESSKIYKLSEDTFIVSAIVSIEEFNEKLQAYIPESAQYSSIGGFALTLFKHIPEKGEKALFDGLEFRAEQVTKNKIVTLRIHKKL